MSASGEKLAALWNGFARVENNRRRMARRVGRPAVARAASATVESLERRQMLTVTSAGVSGPSSVSEHTQAVFVLSATDTVGNGTYWYLRQPDGSYGPGYTFVPEGQTVDWYYNAGDEGSDELEFAVYDGGGSCGSDGCGSGGSDSPYYTSPQDIDITDAPVTFQPSQAPLTATEGQSASVLLGVLLDGDPSPDGGDYDGSQVTWSDGGTSSLTFVGTGADAYGDPLPPDTTACQVFATHTFAEEGTATGDVTITDEGGSGHGGSVAVKVDDAAIGVSVSGPAGAVEGQPLSDAVVGQVTDSNPNATADDFSGTIDWGDGPNGDDGTSTSDATFQATSTPGVFDIIGSHTYNEDGGADVVITVNDQGGSSDSSSNYINVADANILLYTATAFNATEGVNTGLLNIAVLQDQNPNAPMSDFTNNVSINWGDGNSSPATLSSQGGGSFLVQGSYTYAEEGFYTITVTANDAGGSTAIPKTVGVEVQDAPISLTPQGVGAIEQVPTDTMTIATLNDTNTSNIDASDFQGTFQCSDGTSGQLSFVNTGPGTFAVLIPGDTFSDEGTFTVSYSVTDHGASASNATQIAVAEGAMGVSLGASALQGSSDGTQNLVPLTVTTHYEPAATWSLSLTASGANEVDVWQTPNPGPGDTPLLGLVNGSVVSSVYWPAGSTPPSMLYVGAYHGSEAVGDIQFALAEGEPDAPSNTASSQPGTAVVPYIHSAEDPNGDNMKDLTNQTRNLLVGQIVHDAVYLDAPAAWKGTATYKWANPPGVTLYSYSPLSSAPPSPSSSVDLADDNGALPNGGPHTGLTQQEIQFFWVTVPSTDPATLQVTVTVDGQQLKPITTKANVQTPTLTLGNVTTGTGTVFWWDPAVYGPGPGSGDYEVQSANTTGKQTGITIPASVKTPDWAKAGQWSFLQTFTPNEHVALKQVNYGLSVDVPSGTTPINGATVLDSSFPLPAANILDSSGKVVSTAYLNTDGTTYKFVDTPGDDLTAPRPTSLGSAAANAKTTIDHETRNDQWMNYVMFLPPGTGSQWVPLKAVSWTWNFDVQQQPDTSWQWKAGSGPHDPSAGTTQDPTGEPAWSNTWTQAGTTWSWYPQL